MSENIRSTNLRFNLDKDVQNRAWQYLQTMDKKKFKSYSQIIVVSFYTELLDFFVFTVIIHLQNRLATYRCGGGKQAEASQCYCIVALKVYYDFGLVAKPYFCRRFSIYQMMDSSDGGGRANSAVGRIKDRSFAFHRRISQYFYILKIRIGFG